MGLFDFLKDLFNPVKGPPPGKGGPPVSRPGSGGRPVRPLAAGLPPARDTGELAAILRTTPEKVAWLVRETGRHYATWQVPKAHGRRTIEAPKKQLRGVQRAIHREILSRVSPAEAAHGFRKGRSPRTNASPHVAKEMVIKLDLRDFFWQVTRNRVAGLFRSLGYPEDVALVLWRLCCHKGRLPQGAPTSPAITNLVCRRLDARLAAAIRSMNGDYTRYADDLTFSFREARLPMPRLARFLRRIISDEGFRVAPEKTRFLRRSSRQAVTGLTVNAKLSPPRREVRALRALLHEARLRGPEAANRDHLKGFSAVVRGRIEAVRAIDRAKGEKLLAEYRRVSW
ncbi:MAG: RNA-directed DNA polymerase [Planctomycetia bacterium]|nr:RNA-directed DNA polymerase [Planctomycetia bacterium]